MKLREIIKKESKEVFEKFVNTTYSRYDEIPTGLASKEITQGCLVIEGGAFRGIYNQGVLDALMVNNLNVSCVIGVSAGALAGANYISGQIGRAARINLQHRHDSNYIGLKAFKASKSPLNLDYVIQPNSSLEPFDLYRFYDSPQRFVVSTTNCSNGNMKTFEKGKCSDIFSALKASASLPYLSKMVMIEGIPYLDGGCSCQIPFQWAMDQGYQKVVVIKTRDRQYRAKKTSPFYKNKVFYRNYPSLSEKLQQNHETYNQLCDDIDRLEKEGKLFVLAPSQEVLVSRLEWDVEKLGELYQLGYQDTMNQLESLKFYLYSSSFD